MLIKPNSPAFLECAPLLLVKIKSLFIQSKGSKCSTPAETTCIHLRFGACCLRFFVGKFQANKISEFKIDFLKFSSSQSKKTSIFSFISGNLLRTLSKRSLVIVKFFSPSASVGKEPDAQ